MLAPALAFTLGFQTSAPSLPVRPDTALPGVRRTPAPYVRQFTLSDFYVEYRLTVVVETAERLATISTLHANIQDCFNERGVQILSPHFRGQPDHPVVQPRENWYAPPAKSE